MSVHEYDAVDFDMPDEDKDRTWKCFGQLTPASEVVFYTQIIIVYLVIITCIVNLYITNRKIHGWR